MIKLFPSGLIMLGINFMPNIWFIDCFVPNSNFQTATSDLWVLLCGFILSHPILQFYISDMKSWFLHRFLVNNKISSVPFWPLSLNFVLILWPSLISHRTFFCGFPWSQQYWILQPILLPQPILLFAVLATACFILCVSSLAAIH